MTEEQERQRRTAEAEARRKAEEQAREREIREVQKSIHGGDDKRPRPEDSDNE